MTLAALVVWMVLVHAVTQVVTVSKIMFPFRALVPPLKCSMCVGFWVGVALTQYGLYFPGLPRHHGWFGVVLSVVASGMAASAWAHLARALHPDAPEHPDDEAAP